MKPFFVSFVQTNDEIDREMTALWAAVMAKAATKKARTAEQEHATFFSSNPGAEPWEIAHDNAKSARFSGLFDPKVWRDPTCEVSKADLCRLLQFFDGLESGNERASLGIIQTWSNFGKTAEPYFAESMNDELEGILRRFRKELEKTP
jgi:hypothetical protein